jgi:hypothetical protein
MLGTSEEVDLTASMNTYRECARGLWNNFLRPEADFDVVDDFSTLCRTLFANLVLRPIGEYGFQKGSAGDPYPFLRVTPTVDPVPIMINRPSPDRSKYWDEPVAKLGLRGLHLLFIDYFDWDSVGYIDFQYYRVKIVRSEDQPQVSGREALLDVRHAQVKFEPNHATSATAHR